MAIIIALKIFYQYNSVVCKVGEYTYYGVMQPIPKEQISKHIPAATNMHATTEESFLRNESVNTTIGVVGNGVSCSVRGKWL
jgi:hypothetical protein